MHVIGIIDNGIPSIGDSETLKMMIYNCILCKPSPQSSSGSMYKITVTFNRSLVITVECYCAAAWMVVLDCQHLSVVILGLPCCTTEKLQHGMSHTLGLNPQCPSCPHVP